MIAGSCILVSMNALSKEESNRMLGLLEDAVRHSKVPVRRLERQLGLSQGYLAGLFKGRIQLKVSHVYGLAHVLEMEPLFFFLHASPPKDPEWLLRQLGIGTNVLPSSLTAAEPMRSRQEMLDAIRTAIQDEIERIFGKRNEPGPDQG
jgi:transcriptional regulator with XRE-family HTH domain